MSKMHLEEAIFLEGIRVLVCPHCGWESGVSNYTIVEAPALISASGCVWIATCPECSKDSCIGRPECDLKLEPLPERTF